MTVFPLLLLSLVRHLMYSTTAVVVQFSWALHPGLAHPEEEYLPGGQVSRQRPFVFAMALQILVDPVPAPREAFLISLAISALSALPRTRWACLVSCGSSHRRPVERFRHSPSLSLNSKYRYEPLLKSEAIEVSEVNLLQKPSILLHLLYKNL